MFYQAFRAVLWLNEMYRGLNNSVESMWTSRPFGRADCKQTQVFTMYGNIGIYGDKTVYN